MEIQNDGDPVCFRCTSDYLKQVTSHNELKQAFLSVMSYQQRMMVDHHTAANDLTHIKIVLDSFGLLAPNHLKLYLTSVSSVCVGRGCWC